MDAVVNGPGGTAGAAACRSTASRWRARPAPRRCARLNDRQTARPATWKLRDHGLFVGFAPVVNPRYAAAVVIEHGMGGIARRRAGRPRIHDLLFDRDKAMEALDDVRGRLGRHDQANGWTRDYAAWKAGASKPDPGLAQ